MAPVSVVLTVLDLPELLAIVEEAVDAVPEWERRELRERLDALIARAREFGS